MKKIKLKEYVDGFINLYDSESPTFAFATWVEGWSELMIFDPSWDTKDLMEGDNIYIPMPSREDLFRYIQENDMVIVENF